jgi:hypothetical protein
MRRFSCFARQKEGKYGVIEKAETALNFVYTHVFMDAVNSK